MGTMFWAARPTVTVTELYSFAGRLDGARPTDLIVGSEGAIYGWTDMYGPSGGGTVFRLTPEAKLEVLMALTDGPRMRLTEVAPGQFYGCGLLDDEVVLYKLGVTGDVSVLHSFGEFRGAGWLQDRLVRASDGEFFGVTRDSLRQPSRLIKVTPREEVVVVHEFDRSSGGALALMRHSNGNLYGTTRQGGDWNQGTLFRFTPQDGLQIVYSFSGRNGDIPPMRWLLEGARGEIYGDAGGLLVRLRIGEHSTSSESFRLGWSIIGLTRGTDDLVYAASDDRQGEALWRISANGPPSLVHTFGARDSATAGSPGMLVSAGKRTFYTCSPHGGQSGQGAVYRLTVHR